MQKLQKTLSYTSRLDWLMAGGLAIAALVLVLMGNTTQAGWLFAGALISALAAWTKPAQRLSAVIERRMIRRAG